MDYMNEDLNFTPTELSSSTASGKRTARKADNCPLVQAHLSVAPQAKTTCGFQKSALHIRLPTGTALGSLQNSLLQD